MPEFMIVNFERPRRVFVNGVETGGTGEVLRVERGRQTINLGDPRDYDPKWRRPLIEKTSPLAPEVVAFEPAEGG